MDWREDLVGGGEGEGITMDYEYQRQHQKGYDDAPEEAEP